MGLGNQWVWKEMGRPTLRTKLSWVFSVVEEEVVEDRTLIRYSSKDYWAVAVVIQAMEVEDRTLIRYFSKDYWLAAVVTQAVEVEEELTLVVEMEASSQ